MNKYEKVKEISEAFEKNAKESATLADVYSALDECRNRLDRISQRGEVRPGEASVTLLLTAAIILSAVKEKGKDNGNPKISSSQSDRPKRIH